MTVESRERVWFGGISRPRAYASHGLYRPEVAAWLDGSGELLSALATAPGQGSRALECALLAALRRRSLPKPTWLAVEEPGLLDVMGACTELPVRHQKHWAFQLVVAQHLERIAGVGVTPTRCAPLLKAAVEARAVSDGRAPEVAHLTAV
jgi:hypothetical protein